MKTIPDDSDPVFSFYEGLASDYHLIFEDWDRSIIHQGEVLARLLRGSGGKYADHVLDCACGIGTQSLGLARLGLKVTGTDFSPRSIERAKAEAKRLALNVDFSVADFRDLGASVPGMFDQVIACDNALSHLLSEEEIKKALLSIIAKVKIGGLFLATTRDYDAILKERPGGIRPRVFETPEGPRTVTQTWHWAPDGGTYRLEHVIEMVRDGKPVKIVHSTVYRPLRRVDLSRLLMEAGFSNIRWLLPDNKSAFYQPVVIAKRLI